MHPAQIPLAPRTVPRHPKNSCGTPRALFQHHADDAAVQDHRSPRPDTGRSE